MNKWKEQFLSKLSDAQGQHEVQFESALDEFINPAFEDLGSFLGDNGFQNSMPLQEKGRRSFKFELSENAYVLLIFRFTGIGEFELRSETFVPGNEPALEKTAYRVSDVTNEWALDRFQHNLDSFVGMLGKQNAAAGKGQSVEQEELVVA